MPKVHVRKGDKVQVLSGKDKGAQGEVKKVIPSTGRVVVEGVAMVKKAQKPDAQGNNGGIIQKEAAIDASNVMLVCPKCGQPTRVARKHDGKNLIRVCKKCGAEF